MSISTLPVSALILVRPIVISGPSLPSPIIIIVSITIIISIIIVSIVVRVIEVSRPRLDVGGFERPVVDVSRLLEVRQEHCVPWISLLDCVRPLAVHLHHSSHSVSSLMELIYSPSHRWVCHRMVIEP